ncbi:aminotransferase IV [Planosporangium flavigriseum]|uniref:4-amino-4-deoxychorismate lyase n=1 Tax=Planosporangium flavigriseum TaxID=373681 RepID=A0A8J3LKL8_9ACTN|nr:aminotransferase class IV [Planosporangium flavigriseum]NJC63671.1 aminotransferase IV [Planosporangium flavigriseum]GIG72373.1 4-amino-4-deoxychorismate lyase [Planosporangium flavigriseum]
MARVLAVLGVGVVPADTPVLRADDLGVLRGDGVFETMHVRNGEPWLLNEHLDRMARSAALLALPLPSRAELVELAGQACAAWPAETEGALRLVCTRGPEDGGPVTAFATLAPIAPASIAARLDGVAVATATLGVPAEARTEAPWLLGGAKTLSYAVNMASLRWAAQQGVGDVLWVSVDGYALEAPTATLVWLADGVLSTVPAATTGILAGTTAAYLLSQAEELGMRAAERLVRPAELHTADGVWLASSVRGLTEVRSLDGVPLGPSPETTRMQKLLGYV